MITREEATRIAEGIIATNGLGRGVSDTLLLEELSGRAPLVYGGPDLSRCWIAYAIPRELLIGPSFVVLIDRDSGTVLYFGSANDEG